MKNKKIVKLIIVSLIAFLGIFSFAYESFVNSVISQFLSSRQIYDDYGQLSVHFVDVGEADAIAINFPNGDVGMIDCGDESKSSLVMSYIDQFVLTGKRNNHINYFFFTHCDNDHIGGIKRIVSNYDVDAVYRPRQYCSFETIEDKNGYISTSETYEDTITAINQKEIKLTTVFDNMEFFVGDTNIKIFCRNKRYEDSNDCSYFIKITYKNQSILFTGDASSQVESDVMELHADELKSDYLKVAHHGSKYSSSAEFLACVRPKVAIISVGNNIYGHPTEATLSRLDACGAKVYRTDIDGSVLVNLGESSKVLNDSYAKDSFGLDCGTLFIIIEIFNLIVIQKEFVLAIKNRKKLKKLRTKL